MNPRIRLFVVTISDSATSMTIEGGRDFSNTDFPFYLVVDESTWTMTFDYMIALTHAAKFIERRVFYADKRGELANAGPVFRRKLHVAGGEALVVELGLAADGKVYFHFDQKRITVPIDDGADQLFAAFLSFGNVAADSQPPEPGV